MYLEGFLDVLVRSALVGVQSIRTGEMLPPGLATKVLFQSLSRQLNKSAVISILAKRRSTCAYPAGLMKGTMSLNAKYLTMWKKDRCVDYVVEASESGAEATFQDILMGSGTTLNSSFSSSSASSAHNNVMTPRGIPSSVQDDVHGDSPSDLVGGENSGRGRYFVQTPQSGRALLARLLRGQRSGGSKSNPSSSPAANDLQTDTNGRHSGGTEGQAHPSHPSQHSSMARDRSNSGSVGSLTPRIMTPQVWGGSGETRSPSFRPNMLLSKQQQAEKHRQQSKQKQQNDVSMRQTMAERKRMNAEPGRVVSAVSPPTALQSSNNNSSNNSSSSSSSSSNGISSLPSPIPVSISSMQQTEKNNSKSPLAQQQKQKQSPTKTSPSAASSSSLSPASSSRNNTQSQVRGGNDKKMQQHQHQQIPVHGHMNGKTNTKNQNAEVSGQKGSNTKEVSVGSGSNNSNISSGNNNNSGTHQPLALDTKNEERRTSSINRSIVQSMNVTLEEQERLEQEREAELERREVERRQKREREMLQLEKKAKEEEATRVVRIRRLLTMGAVFYKHGRNKRAERRFVFVDKRLREIAWRSTTTKKTKKPTKVFLLADVIGVSQGLVEAGTKPVQSEKYCLTLRLTTRTIQLECDNERHRNDWLEAFRWLLSGTCP